MGQKQLPEEMLRKTKASGYSYGAHHQGDSKVRNITYVPKTIRDQSTRLTRYEMCVYLDIVSIRFGLTRSRRRVESVIEEQYSTKEILLDDVVNGF